MDKKSGEKIHIAGMSFTSIPSRCVYSLLQHHSSLSFAPTQIFYISKNLLEDLFVNDVKILNRLHFDINFNTIQLFLCVLHFLVKDSVSFSFVKFLNFRHFCRWIIIFQFFWKMEKRWRDCYRSQSRGCSSQMNDECQLKKSWQPIKTCTRICFVTKIILFGAKKQLDKMEMLQCNITAE